MLVLTGIRIGSQVVATPKIDITTTRIVSYGVNKLTGIARVRVEGDRGVGFTHELPMEEYWALGAPDSISLLVECLEDDGFH